MKESTFFVWYETEHCRLHKAWSADVGTPGYDKSKWLKREQILNDRARRYATDLGIEPPYLRPPSKRAQEPDVAGTDCDICFKALWACRGHDKHEF